MTTGDIKLIREFVAAAQPWHKHLSAAKLSQACPTCRVIPDRMMRLAKTLEAFLAAYDKKHGKTN